MGEVIEATVVGEEEIISEDEIEQAEEVGQKLRDISGEATDIEVTDEESYVEAIERKRNLEALYDLIESIVDPMRESAYRHYKDILSYKKNLLSSGEEAIEYLKTEVENYADEQGTIEGESEEGNEESVPRVEGTHYRENWKGEVVDKQELIQAVANGDAPQNLIDINSKEINKLARQFKENLGNIPGLKATVNRTLVDRG